MGHDLLFGRRGQHCGLGRDDQLVGAEFGTGGDEHVPAQLAGGIRNHGAFGEQGDERGVPSRGLREDRGDTVESFERLGAVGIRQLRIGLGPGPFFAHEQGDDLKLDAVQR